MIYIYKYLISVYIDCKLLFKISCAWLFSCKCIRVPCVGVVLNVQKKVGNPLGLQLGVIVSLHLDTGIWSPLECQRTPNCSTILQPWVLIEKNKEGTIWIWNQEEKCKMSKEPRISKERETIFCLFSFSMSSALLWPYPFPNCPFSSLVTLK